jgi:FdhD protein
MSTARIVRWERGRASRPALDELAGEEPLEIRIDNRTVAVTMRTPGHDKELAAGFVLSEGIIDRGEQLVSIASHPRNKTRNVIGVFLADGVKLDLKRLDRHSFVSSSCGLCGKTSIDAVRRRFAPVRSRVRIDAALLAQLPEKLREHQAEFARTGGLHAAGIFDFDANLIVSREDIGRHNAVDKVLGYGLLNGLLPFDRHVLMRSNSQRPTAKHSPVLFAATG